MYLEFNFRIRGGVLEPLPSLVSLDLGLNMISSLEMNVFIGNMRLEMLVLDNNQVIRRVGKHLPFSSI